MTDETAKNRDLPGLLRAAIDAPLSRITPDLLRAAADELEGRDQSYGQLQADRDQLRLLVGRFMACRSEDGAGWRVSAGASAGDALNKVYLTARKYLAGSLHSDDAAVDRFAVAMKAKLAKKRGEGRGGWDDDTQCHINELARLLVHHVAKGDPVDIGNFAMMLFNRKGSAEALRAVASNSTP